MSAYKAAMAWLSIVRKTLTSMPAVPPMYAAALLEVERTFARPELPPIGHCVDITAEKLQRFFDGQAPWDPRGELLFFKHKHTADRCRWISRYRIGIHILSVDGVGVTKGDKYRLSLRNRHEGRKDHRRWNEAKAAKANSQTQE